MGNLIEIGDGKRGYLAMPEGKGKHPGVLVVQEWWGLDSGIKEMADRLAAAGFVALAPDLYRGELAEHHEVDKADALMKKLPPERAGADMSSAVDYLATYTRVTGPGIGVMGFCMGGLLSWVIATNRPDRVKAVVPFYGYPLPGMNLDYSKLAAPVQGHMAENDSFFPPEGAKALEAKLRELGKDVTLTVYPGTGHAFMGPHNAFGTLDQALADKIWPQAVTFLKQNLS